MPPKKKDGSHLEKKYKKVSQREHVLLRPEMYVGSIEEVETPMWQVRGATNLTMEYKNVKLNQGLLKIFDEIIVNAADNIARSKSKQTYISVDITADGIITVCNDGDGIPVVEHSKHKIYIPDMIFGHLLTSSNYDNDPDSVAAGRHGYGAKLTNILSLDFSVTTQCKGARFEGHWTNNMADADDIVIKKAAKSDSGDFTEISFLPEYSRFGCETLTKDMRLVFARRCLDLAVTFPNIKVTFNGKTMPSHFSKYVSGLLPSEIEPQDRAACFYCAELTGTARSKERAHLGIFVSSEASFRRDVSSVNGVMTHNGGTHVQHFVDQLSVAAEKAAKLYKAENPGTAVSTRKMVNLLNVVALCQLVQPKFDSQSKVRLVSDHHKPGKIDVDAVAEWILQLPMFDQFVQSERASIDKMMKRLGVKGSSTHLRLPKLLDAANAGRGTDECTLLVTEGDSAKALAVSSLTADMKHTFGVFPLRGKVLNVRNDVSKLKNNTELQHLFMAIGLQTSNPHIESPKALRYQRVMIMTDQDPDGSHIRGLLINTFEKLWPKLAAYDGFLSLFITPLLKATTKTETIPFFNKKQYEGWVAANEKKAKPEKFTVKYYKGLGTSTATEGREYVREIDKHTLKLTNVDAEPKKLLHKVFDKDHADWRKKWVTTVSFENDPSMDGLKEVKGVKQYPLTRFLNNEFIHFAIYDNMRTMPSVMDGQKIVNRKVLWSMFNRTDAEMKVSQLTGYVSMVSAYHHGEASLQAAIVKMAQDFVGSNNVPLLQPLGQFGTRIMNGGDSAAPRYIFTRLSPLARAVFPIADDALLEPVVDDGNAVEPKFYAPVIPMVFANGSIGIGVGFACNIPNYNPLDLSKLVRRKLQKETKVNPNNLPVHCVGFRGVGTAPTSELNKPLSAGCYTLHEVPRAKNKVMVRITELPLYYSTEQYRSTLDGLMENKDIIDYDDFSTGTAVDFDVLMRQDLAFEWLEEGLFIKNFRLAQTHSPNHTTTSSNQTIQSHGMCKKAMFEEYFKVRLDLYKKRRVHLLNELEKDLKRTESLVKFSVELRAKKFNLVEMDAAALNAYLRKQKYHVDPDTDDFAYLTTRTLSSIMKTNLERLEAKILELKKEKKELTSATPEDLWIKDLDNFDSVFQTYQDAQCAAIEKELAGRKVGRAIQEPVGSKSKGLGGRGGADAAGGAAAAAAAVKGAAASAKGKAGIDLCVAPTTTATANVVPVAPAVSAVAARFAGTALATAMRRFLWI